MIDQTDTVDHRFDLREGELDTGDRGVLVRGRRPVPAELVLRVIVRNPWDPPCPGAGGLLLAEVELPHLIRAIRVRGEGSFVLLSEFPTLLLVVSAQCRSPTTMIRNTVDGYAWCLW